MSSPSSSHAKVWIFLAKPPDVYAVKEVPYILASSSGSVNSKVSVATLYIL